MGAANIRATLAKEVRRRELLISIAVVLLIIVLLFTTLGSYPLEGQSMEPTTYNGQSIVIIRAAYWFGAPQRGDVITFRHPVETDRGLIKRVIALPGEWVEVTTECVYIDGKPLDEPYIQGRNYPTYPRTLVPAGCYFVMGDNRDHSTDSRIWGMLPRENITGRAWLVYWPLSDWHLIRGYSYDVDRISSRVCPEIPRWMLTSLCTRSIIIGDFKYEGGVKVANETGKRYMCEKCGSEFIVTRAGNGSINCCGQPMKKKN